MTLLCIVCCTVKCEGCVGVDLVNEFLPRIGPLVTLQLYLMDDNLFTSVLVWLGNDRAS